MKTPPLIIRRSRARIGHSAWLAVALSLTAAANPGACETAPVSFQPNTQLRRPIAVEVVGQRLWIANRESGSISTISLPDNRVIGETPVAARLADLVAFPDRSAAVAIDPQRHQVVVLEIDCEQPKTVARHAAPHSPVSIQRVNERQLTIASLWARQISLWTWSGAAEHADCEHQKTLTLPFAPRLQCLSPDGMYLIVADSFGPYLGIIDLLSFQLRGIVIIPGHNIRGLTISDDQQRLLIAHQLLNEFVPTTRDHVFWGTVVGNLLRSIPLSRLSEIQGGARVKIHGSLFPIGREGNAAGDPGELLLTDDGDVLLAIYGTGELARRRRHELQFQRIKIGQGPLALAFAPGRKHVYVASRFDDSISQVCVDSLETSATIGLGPMPALTPSEAGEIRFHDARLSLDGWLSCHSCHTDGHSGDFVNDNFGDDTIGAPKRIPSLLGTAVTAPWSWTGSEESLSAQIRKSLYQTMHGGEKRRFREEDVLAITSFVQSLAPAPAIAVAQRRAGTVSVQRGQQQFQRHGCGQCHPAPTYTSPETFSVGLSDELNANEFNPPSLRGVSQRRQYLHDGRAENLHEVFSVHAHPNDTQWDDDEVAELVAFLETL